MIDQDIDIEGTVIKKSKLLSFFEKYLVDPIKDVFNKSEDAKKTEYADCIIQNNKKGILLLQRSYEAKFMPGTWCLPGGHIDEGEESDTAVHRELSEKAGFDTQLSYLKTVTRKDSISHYYQGIFSGSISDIILDNKEHYRYEFVPIENIDRYNLILDLGDILESVKEDLFPVLTERNEFSNVLEAIAVSGSMSLDPTVAEVNEFFDKGQISEDDFTRFTKVNSALEIITKGFDKGLVSEEDFVSAIQKSKEIFQEILKNKNDYLLKSILSSQIENGEVDASFELIKSAFDQGMIEEDLYLDYLVKYQTIEKADPSHGGKLEKVTLIDKNGKKEVKWMSKEEAKTSENSMGEKTKHTYDKLHEFAKDTPEKELKRIINESHDEKLRKAAHKELDRRKNKEAVNPDKKPTVKKKVEPQPQKSDPDSKKSEVTEKEISEISDPVEALEKIKDFFKDDKLINKTIDFIEPIIESNKKIKIDTKYKFDSGVLGLSFPDGKIAVNFEALKGDEDLMYRTMLHEMVHAATRNEIKTNPAFREDLTDILSDIRTALRVPDNESIVSLFHAKGIIDDNLYGASNEYEMVAEIFSNQKFYNYLAGIQYKGDSILKRIFTSIAKVFSQKYKTVSDAKSKVSAENTADYLMQLTQSVINNSKFINYNSNK